MVATWSPNPAPDLEDARKATPVPEKAPGYFYCARRRVSGCPSARIGLGCRHAGGTPKMPALKPTDFFAQVAWIGCVTGEGQGIPSALVDVLEVGFDGPVGERHGGRTRPSCSRVTSQHPRGTPIANVRQLSVLSSEDLESIAAAMGLAEIDPAWLGATLVVSGLPDFTCVPPSSRLQGPDGVTLIIDMENRPCHLPAREIEARFAGKGKSFKAAAKGRRGVTAWVERPGRLTPGDRLRLHVPDQPVWPHLEAARG